MIKYVIKHKVDGTFIQEFYGDGTYYNEVPDIYDATLYYESEIKDKDSLNMMFEGIECDLNTDSAMYELVKVDINIQEVK